MSFSIEEDYNAQPTSFLLLISLFHLDNVILSVAKNLYDCLRDPSLTLRVTYDENRKTAIADGLSKYSEA
jgi:hypothetical protein